ncbi:SSI family serine proteinase inhibitor [Arthrobacter sp. G.S.26]|uniref:SSI family serine proteinase inhibitor n=1 Tax=Arthrobacter sp. G.S.26 TaxID=3433706 RepID=UPI003D76C09A
MRSARWHLALLVLAAGLLASCSGAPGTVAPSSAPAASASASASASADPDPLPDPGSTVPAPSPEASPPPSAGPGQGDAELAISVVPDVGQEPVNYTLVCRAGVPAAESSHPTAQAACAALKANAALLSPPKPTAAVGCTQEYGGPQKATVTGVVDGVPVDTAFSRNDGCAIGAWNAARSILGPAGGAV